MSAGLLAALGRLDSLLASGVAAAAAAYGAEARGDAFRGLHIDLAEVQRLLARDPAAPILTANGSAGPSLPTDAFHAVVADAGLSTFDLDVVVIALAPELDLRYERLYAYLQDDVGKRRPTVDLVLNLLCASAAEKIARRAHFQPDAPLLRGRVVRLLAVPGSHEPPLLARALAVDDQITTLLVGGGLDARLAAFCTLVSPPESGLPVPAELDGLAEALAEAAISGAPLRVYLRGPAGTGRHRVVDLAAARAGKRLLIADLARAPADLGELLPVLVREASVQNAICLVTGLDPEVSSASGPDLHLLGRELASANTVFVLTGARRWPAVYSVEPSAPLAMNVIQCPVPGFAHRRWMWADHLARSGIPVGEDDLDTLAGRFRLTPTQIAEAVGTAAPLVADGKPAAEDVFCAARAQTGQELGGLATKIEPMFGWDDLVLPADSGEALREICQRVAYRERVLHQWDFAGKLSLGRGVAALFAGPPGTGKTMAAEVVARELRCDLYRIDLAGIVSKWIGETEKNLDRIFGAAENANAILFFDEADALFGKRSEVQDAHDRYANIEVSYLLQKMESYEGVAILATNRFENLDEAFLRRLAFVVRFPFPEPAERLRIWTEVWPDAVPLAADLDWEALAFGLSLSGAEIKNVALAAAFLAAESGTSVTFEHLQQASRREYEKGGRTLVWPIGADGDVP